MDASFLFACSLAPESPTIGARDRARAHRRRADRARRRPRARGLRGALRALRPPRARARPPPPRRSRPGRGLRPGGVRRRLALGLELRPRRAGPGGAWLYTIARNAIVDVQRRRTVPTVADPPELVATGPTPDEEAEASWNAWRVHRALETLPERRAGGDRPRVLLRLLAERGRGVPPHPARHRQDANAQRARPARRCARRESCEHQNPPPFDELIEADDPDRARLQQAHELLVAAGASARAAAVARVGAGRAERHRDHASRAAATPRSRRSPSPPAVLFGVGYAIGGRDSPDEPVQTIAMTGAGGATASIALLAPDEAGNWPMQLEVSGLPPLPDRQELHALAHEGRRARRVVRLVRRRRRARRRCRSTRRTS